MPSGPTPFQARFVTACQQLLALAVVCAALTPALGVVSLDVVARAPSGAAGGALMSAHGEEALKSSKLVPNAQLKVYPGGPHGLPATMRDRFNKDLMAFLAS